MHYVYSIRLFNIREDPKNNNKITAYLLSQAEDLSNLPWLARISGSGSELLKFTSRTLVERTKIGTYIGCKENNFMCWVKIRNDGMAGVVITDDKYSERIAFNLIDRSMTRYESNPKSWDWSATDYDRVYGEMSDDLKDLIVKYQDPDKIDSLSYCKNEIEKTKVKLYKSVDLILERGEKIEDLADKSADLSIRSKSFAKKAKKLNSWCPDGCILM